MKLKQSTLKLKTLLNEYLYKLSHKLVKNWQEFRKDNSKQLKHFTTYTEACMFVDRMTH